MTVVIVIGSMSFCSGRRDVSFIFIDSWHIFNTSSLPPGSSLVRVFETCFSLPSSLFIKYRWDISLQDNSGLETLVYVSMKQERWKHKHLLRCLRQEVLDGPCFRNLGWPGSCWDGICPHWSLGWVAPYCALLNVTSLLVSFFLLQLDSDL